MNCTLDDIRPSRESTLTRLMERTTSLSSAHDTEKDAKTVRSMLDVTIRRGPNDIFGKYYTVIHTIHYAVYSWNVYYIFDI